jgi:putative heme-binding domain-containing protein
MASISNVPRLGFFLLILALAGSAWITTQQAARNRQPLENPKVDKLKLLPGFKAEHLYSPSDNKQGSWVSMTFDDKGRMICSDQYGFLYRLTMPPVGTTAAPNIEKLHVGPPPAPGDTTQRVGMGYAQGLLYAFNSLYVMVNHRVSPSNKTFDKGSGLYRLEDTDGNDQFDKITLLKELKGEGEHGPHSIVLAPDKQSVYVMCGNFTDVPRLDAYRLPPVWQEDNLFPAIRDPRGHAVDRMAPGGWLAKVSPDGQRWEFMGGGFRNTFDFAFNDAGDIFGYDSDMEWDFGLPWYKPTRICHITSGAEFGWRTSASNWSPAYMDCLPATLNLGQGSPTGVFAGRGAAFPAKYQKTIYAFDWSFGIVYAVHLQPKGASYSATAEEFVSGAPLPITDGLIGPDGAMYFLTGGRRLESDLYRVTYTGPESTAPAPAIATTTPEHKLRTQLEQYHTGPNPAAVNAAWPHLSHPDRFVRYAARLAVEHQPVAQWQARALAEKDPLRLSQAMFALAHHGDKVLKSQMLAALTGVKLNTLNEEGQLHVLRAIELICTRFGLPEGTDRANVIAALNPLYPANTVATDRADLNRFYCKLLISLEAPGAVEKTMKLMALKNEGGQGAVGGETVTASSDLIMRNPQYGLDIARMLEKFPPAQQTFYATMLSSAKTGWTPALRDAYFQWFSRAFDYQGGRSYVGFINKARKLALANVPEDQRARYDKLSGVEKLSSTGNDIVEGGWAPKNYRQWKFENALAAVDSMAQHPLDYEQGRQIYSVMLCGRCHAMQGQGGDIGPDLTQLGTRFSNKDIMEAIMYPDKVVSDQYAATVFTLRNGKSVTGRLVGEDKTNFLVSQNPFVADDVRKVAKASVVNRKYSPVSLMMPGLVNSLSGSELRNLVAYLKSGGKPDAAVYKESSKGK